MKSTSRSPRRSPTPRPRCAGLALGRRISSEVRQALGRIVKDGNRAGDVIGRIRALIKKAPPRKDRLEINEAIREVIELTRGEAVKNGVSVQTQLADGLPLIQGDRVQLQQVILNLIINAVEAMSGVERGIARVADQHRRDATRTACSSRCGIRVRDWTRRASSASSRPSTRPSPAAWAWDCRSAVDHRGARGTGVGRRKRTPGRRLSVHAASGTRRDRISPAGGRRANGPTLCGSMTGSA